MKARVIVALGLVLLFAPLLPAAWLRNILHVLAEFPLRTHHVSHPSFSPIVYAVFSAVFAVLLAVLIFPRWFGFSKVGTDVSSVHGPAGGGSLPFWGFAGVLLCAVSWILAWNRFPILESVQGYTFFFLWLGYILTVDALVFARSGTSTLHSSKRTFFMLFPASALAWWYFEYLNRFVQNWWYAGVDDYSAWRYALMATVSFATVFPAIFETRDLLMTFPRFRSVYSTGPRWFTPSRGVLWLILAVGTASLFLTGIFPSSLFFLTWFSPLVILGASLALAGIETPLSSMRRGDYNELFALAVAALICGFFWELWNSYSMPKWYYSIPCVMKGKLFEMPLPGYGGYLPFGPICGLLWIALCAIHRSKRSTFNTQH